MEMWKYIDECSNYQVSSDGRVRSFAMGKNGYILKQEACRNGYLRVSIHRKHFLVHRLVAKAFISNPKSKPMINHKDGNRKNNKVSNLEWCTNRENQIHAMEVLNVKCGGVSPKKVCCVETKEVFASLHQASRAKNVQVSHICSAAKGSRDTAGGFRWAYV